MQYHNAFSYSVVALAYVLLLYQSVRYFRGSERAFFSTLFAVLAGLALPLSAILLAILRSPDALFDASPVMYLAWIAAIIGGIRGERPLRVQFTTKTRPPSARSR